MPMEKNQRFTRLNSLRRVATIICAVTVLGVAQTGVKAQSTVPDKPKILDGTRLSLLYDQNVPVDQRIAKGIEYLKQELEQPTQPCWGMAGGPIDTGYVQVVIAGVIGQAAYENPEILRKFRDQETNPRVKELLTVSLAVTRARDTIPELLRIAASDKVPAIRGFALSVVDGFLRKPTETDRPIPGRLRPGEVWQPLDASTVDAVKRVALAALKDPAKHFRGPSQENALAFFAVQRGAAYILRLLGCVVEPVPEGWHVKNKRGQLVHRVLFNRGDVPLPDVTRSHDPNVIVD